MNTIDGSIIELSDDERLAFWLFESRLDEGDDIPKAARITQDVFRTCGMDLTPEFWAWLAR